MISIQFELEEVMKNLSPNNSLCRQSFAYGWLIAKGIDDEWATYISEKY